MLTVQRSRFYPYKSVDEHDVINLFAAKTTGQAGVLVKIDTGSANPQNADGLSSFAMGYNYNQAGTYIYANQYENKMRVEPTISGDTAYNVLGLTELATLTHDENGIPLKFDERRAKELGVVISGQTVPVITKGVVGIWGKFIDQSTSPVQAGYVACVSRSGDGRLASVDPTDATKFHVSGAASWVYTPKHVVGKWLTSLPTATNTGLANEFSSMGGYALLQFDATA
jgi:hypothetical protein